MIKHLIGSLQFGPEFVRIMYDGQLMMFEVDNLRASKSVTISKLDFELHKHFDHDIIGIGFSGTVSTIVNDMIINYCNHLNGIYKINDIVSLKNDDIRRSFRIVSMFDNVLEIERIDNPSIILYVSKEELAGG